jgi:hypothetical protein
LADPETTTREDIPDFAGEARRPTAES